MKDIQTLIKRYHIPSLVAIGDDFLLFRYESLSDIKIGVSKSMLDNLTHVLSCPNIDALKVTELFHSVVPGPWLKGSQELSKLYYAPYSASNVIPGDLIAMLHCGEDSKVVVPDISIYLGHGRYLLKHPHYTKFLGVKSCNLGNIFPNKHKWVMRGFEKDYGEKFETFYTNLYSSGGLQISIDKLSPDMGYEFTATQRLYDSFVSEIYSVYSAFGDEQVVKNIILTLNERKVIQHIRGNYYLHQNRNSNCFYRDANYSLSIVDHVNGKEVAMMSFAPSGDSIEVVQIGGNPGYNLDFMYLWTIIMDYMKQYFSQLGFGSIKVLRGDKNINYIHPKQRGLPQNFDIKRHQETLRIRYNATPNRKWGFTKPDEWYSYFDFGGSSS